MLLGGAIVLIVLGSSSFAVSLESHKAQRASNLLSEQTHNWAGLIAKAHRSAAFAQASPFIVNNSTIGVCICVTVGSCGLAGGTVTTTDGSGVIDIRIVANPTTVTPVATPLTTVAPVSSGLTPQIASQSFCQAGLERCCPSSGFSCGIRYPPIFGARAPNAGQAAFGAYPWQVVLLAPGDVFQGSGALIDHLHVLTAAHKVQSFTTSGIQLKARLGEWDSGSATEPIPAQEFFVSRIFIHPQFNAANLKNDIALLRLSSFVPLGAVPTISTACLPSNQLTGMRCWIAGWGRNDFSTTGAYQAVMREVDVPLVDQTACQNLLRATRLGANFALDSTSFMCAGGENGKDACTGDGGSPLVCQSSGKWFVMGLVAWGIGCGSSNVPGVYVNIPSYLGWIQSTTRS